ncbi:hypothetical protein [Neofamilia massiliensis]|uniref:hypothetical protein n=1 Tax=Neofamilia massiliensis TaxID=1673724 RepID=UPI0006BB7945|nr:hypothetical protein [Neofamilia massiliensis]
MNKRILSLVLALVMVLGTFAVVSAEEAKVENISQANKIQWLVDNKIVEGHKVNKDGEKDLDLEGTLTREQATKLIVYTVGKEKLAEVLQGVMKPFPDVDTDRWSNGFVSVARTEKNAKTNQPIVIGFEDGNFKPEKELSYAELATMLVRIVKNDLTNKMVENAVWATSWMRWAEELGILDGIKVVNSDAPISRRDAFEMIYNTKVALGDTRYNKVDFGDKMGIISKLQAGKVEINQDKDMTYNITYETVFTDGTNIFALAQNAARPGSLVRLITDKDNNVLYMIELGNYTDGAKARRWDTVADYTISSMRANKARFAGHDVLEFHEGTKVNLMSDTRYFVADPANNFLKEIDSLTDAMKYYGAYDKATNTWANKEIENVYAGYNKTKWGREAKVVVFNTTHKSNTKYNLLRVYTDGVNSLHNVTLQDTDGTYVTSNSSKYFPGIWFPGNWTYDYMDVVEFRTVKEGNNVFTKPVKVIDYSEANVYEVVKFNRSNREIELIDKYNRKATFAVNPDTAEFLEGQTRPGNHVQVSFADKAMKEIDVISNVNLALRGALVKGVNTELTKKVKLDRVYADNNSYYVVVRDFFDNGVYGAARTYKVTADDYEKLEKLAKEAKDVILKITLSTNDNGYQTPVVVEFEEVSRRANSETFKKTIEGLVWTKDMTEANYGTQEKAEELREELVDAINEYNGLEKSEKKSVSKEAGDLNTKIEAFNKLEQVKDGYVEKLEKVEIAK